MRDVAGAADVVAASGASPGPGKVVVVSTTRDPATPYQAGVDLARQLGAALITFEGTQHTVVFNGDACVDTAVVASWSTGCTRRPVCGAKTQRSRNFRAEL